jgi:hypothetical protein
MERHCNTLLPSIKSRRHPYESINSFVTATAQLDQIRLLYNLDDELSLDPDKQETHNLVHDECMSNCFPLYHSLLICSIDPHYMLSNPRRKDFLPLSMRNKVWACLATRFSVQKKDVKAVIKLDKPIIQYGRVTRLEGGDCMIGCDLVKQSEDRRDASFVRVEFYITFV